MVSRKLKKHGSQRHMRKSHGTDEDGNLHENDAHDNQRRDAENKKLMKYKGITEPDIEKEMRKGLKN